LLDDDGSLTVCIFGDGASNQGVLQESLNFAARWQLPFLYVCEHNGFCQFSPADTVTAGTISDRAKPFGIPVEVCDGNDVRDVWRAVGWATEHIRAGNGPAFVEARTYRINNHFEREHLVVQTPYRTQDEVEEWRADSDPIEKIETEKVAQEVTALVSGKLVEILVEEEAELAVGDDVCIIETDETVEQSDE
jgi:pyruvate dehydrogenase E1 component alpha subunit